MSERAVQLGTVKYLREKLNDTSNAFVGYHPAVKPPEAMGQWFVAIGNCTSSRGPTISADVNDRVYTLQIRIYTKNAYAPDDRLGNELAQISPIPEFAGPTPPTAQTSPGLLELADQINAWIIESYPLNNTINTLINPLENGIIEPFHQSTIGTAGAVPGMVDAWAVTVTASGMRRIRSLRY